MASNENEKVPGKRVAAGPSAEDVIASVRADFAAIDARVFRDTAAVSLDESLAEIRTTVARLFEPSRG